MSLTKKTYKVELDPNNKQRSHLNQHAAAARIVWNWALSHRKRYYKRAGKDISYYQQKIILNRLKKTKFNWLYNVSRSVPGAAIKYLDEAYTRFFNGQNNYPKFKKKNRSRDSFYIHGTIKVHKDGKFRRSKIPVNSNCLRPTNKHFCERACRHLFKAPKLQIPNLGAISIKEIPDLPISSRIVSVTIKRSADRWFALLNVEQEIQKIVTNCERKVGIDLGLSKFAVLYNGKKAEYIENPKILKNHIKKVKRLSKSLDHKKIGSSNYKKEKLRLARVHKKVVDLRYDFLQKLTTRLVQDYGTIVVEDLNIHGLLSNSRMSAAIHDVGWGIFIKLLTEKCEWYGRELVKAPRFYPSTKTCSNCGEVKASIKLRERTFKCVLCGFTRDRDENASINLWNFKP